MSVQQADTAVAINSNKQCLSCPLFNLEVHCFVSTVPLVSQQPTLASQPQDFIKVQVLGPAFQG